jgi:hypothetical protein
VHFPIYVPKWLIYVGFVVGAVCVGWIGKDAFGGAGASSAGPTSTNRTAFAPSDDESASPQPLSLTIVMPPPMVVPGGQPIAVGSPPVPGGLSGASGGVSYIIDSASGRSDHVGSRPSSGVHTGRGVLHVIDRGAGATGNAVRSVLGSPGTLATVDPLRSAAAPSSPRVGGGAGYPPSPVAGAYGRPPPVGTDGQVSGPNGLLRASPGMGSASTQSRLILDGVAGAFPRADGARSSGAGGSSLADGLVLNLTPEMAATAIGQNIVIAYDGSVVLVGDNGYLNANTGDASEGAVVALDAQGSTFSSNYDPTITGVAAMGASPTSAWAPAMGTSPSTGTGTGAPPRPGILSGGSPMEIPQDASPLVSAFISYTQNRTADIAGFEDHSILARGMGNVLTYDDSNVFIDRLGQINANTGDTDSAGLNAVDTVRSTVSAGPHCDDGCDNESVITAQSGAVDEGDVSIDASGNIVLPEDDSLPFDNGDDTDSPFDESPDGDISDPVEPAETREEADTTREDADTGVDPPWVDTGAPAPAGSGAAPAPDGSLTVGGDGIDDLSARVDGVGNVATYDDSNVVIGGAGDVNAQIGDSDTGGTVVMDTVDSVAHGGNSR